MTRPRKMAVRLALAVLLVAAATDVSPAQEVAEGLGPPERVVFLDNRAGVVNGSTNYDPETRSCALRQAQGVVSLSDHGTGSSTVFTELDDAAQALADADTLYVRAGTYSRASVGKYIQVHGNRVNYWTGALAITASGTSEKRKLVSAYGDELAIIQARPGVSNYNPDPGDTSFKNSSHFYPNPAISIHGSYVDVVGFKTYGQVVIARHDVTVQGCDLGGGGPHMNQGQAVVLNSNAPGGVYNIVVSNNLIHHSSWGESVGNGSAFMGYNFSCIIEHNEFFDNFGPDIRIKDTKNQQGRDVIIRFNLFRPSDIGGCGVGVSGLNQAKDADHILIHNNIFLEKNAGILWDGIPRVATVAYNNTFVNCRGRGATSGDITEWQKAPVNAQNNIYYHSQPAQKFYDLQTPLGKLNSDHNLFYSAASDTHWLHLYRKRGTALADWQEYSGKDQHSVWKDPGFVKPAGNRPEDFRRRGSPGDVVGSEYGPVCGAYVTGDEVVGIPEGQNRWQESQ